MRFKLFALVLSSVLLFSYFAEHARAQVSYDIVYMRAPRYGDNTTTHWPEVFDPFNMEPGADLMLLHPDGTEELLVPGGMGSIVDPYISFDGRTVFYAKFHDLRPSMLNGQRRNAPYGGSDIYKLDLATRVETRLTFQEWTPNTAIANWSSDRLRPVPNNTNYLGYGIMNLGPCPLPGNKLMFSSSRNGFIPNKGYTFPNLQLFVMDQDGRNVELVGHMNLGSALHPTILADGRVMFSSFEAQGLRDSRLWGLWAIWPDGRVFEPLMSAFKDASAFHFQTQLPNKDIAVVEYYNLNNNGFGTLLAFNPQAPAGVPPFGPPKASDPSNPLVRRGIWWFDPSHPAHKRERHSQYPFSPPGLRSISAFTHGEDEASSKDLNGGWAGKVTHPSAAPNGDLLLVWTPGPANDLNRPTTLPWYDGGLYLVRGSNAIDDHHNLVLIKNDPRYNEMQPRAVTTYREIYGVDKPVNLSWLPNNGTRSAELPAGAPFGLVGTSSFYKRNSAPGFGSPAYNGIDVFNTGENGQSPNWSTQGADAGKYSNDDIYAVRILAMEPSSHISYGPDAADRNFYNHATERLRILGEIPLRKGAGANDPDGNPDTSFLAKIPADVPFTFQTLDKDGMVLNMAQTWHQVRPGEVRTDCGGCHAHSQLGTDFSQTAAGRPGFVATDLTANTKPILSKDSSGNPTIRQVNAAAIDVEYYRDIRPILQRSCVQCHSGVTAAAGLDLNDPTPYALGWMSAERTYARLADDQEARWGIKPVINNGTWRQTNASRYIRAFQSRRSLLIWKIFGRRLDGWTNADHPTESVPGDRTTLPPGANPNAADLDYTGTIMPPPGSGVPPLSEDEKLMFARWIDLGSPVSSQAPGDARSGWFADDLRPTLAVSLPRRGHNVAPLTAIRVGMFDYYSGLDPASISIKANIEIDGHAPGTELASLFSTSGNSIWSYTLATPWTELPDGTITFSVKDRAGISRPSRARSPFPQLIQVTIRAPVEETAAEGDVGGNQPPGIFLNASAFAVPMKKKVNLQATILDDRLPSGPVKRRGKKVTVKPGKVTVVFEQLSGPVGGKFMKSKLKKFDNKGKTMVYKAKVKLKLPGEYVFRFVASDGEKTSSQTVTVNVF